MLEVCSLVLWSCEVAGTVQGSPCLTVHNHGLCGRKATLQKKKKCDHKPISQFPYNSHDDDDEVMLNVLRCHIRDKL